MNAIPRPQGREAIKAWHRQKIIDATIEVITTHGIAGTTIAKVVELADVSMGLVNSHFTSKDFLLGQVLRQMADEYKAHWHQRLQQASPQPVAQLSAMVLADFDAEVMNLRPLGVWFAFRAQVRARPEYLELVGMREREQLQKTMALFASLNRESRQPQDPATLARLMSALLEGLWTEFYLYPNDFERDKSIAAVFAFLEAFYPGQFGQATE
jgi:TetR/AcrR family transcriptional repressor of bet genes